MTIKPTIKWGVWGTLVCLAAYALVFALEAIFHGHQPIWLVFRVMNYPMILLWDASGLLQDDALKWNTWFNVSLFLFPLIVGFGIGALKYRIFVSR
jgi:hypothetical protein